MCCLLIFLVGPCSANEFTQHNIFRAPGVVGLFPARSDERKFGRAFPLLALLPPQGRVYRAGRDGRGEGGTLGYRNSDNAIVAVACTSRAKETSFEVSECWKGRVLRATTCCPRI